METMEASTTLNISLTLKLKQFIERRAGEGGYVSSSEYVRELIRDAQKRALASSELEGLLLEGLHSGSGRCVDKSYWQDKEQELLTKASKQEGH